MSVIEHLCAVFLNVVIVAADSLHGVDGMVRAFAVRLEQQGLHGRAFFSLRAGGAV